MPACISVCNQIKSKKNEQNKWTRQKRAVDKRIDVWTREDIERDATRQKML